MCERARRGTPRFASSATRINFPGLVIDRIHIEQLKVQARIGVPRSERAERQRLLLNVTLWPLKNFPLGDDLANTVNYSAVAKSVEAFVGDSEYKLIETLAEETAAQLLIEFDLRKVAVEVRKFVLPNAAYVSVTAVRESAPL